jgi:altronate hydrolase
LINELVDYASGFEREKCSIENLVVGHKCGGSDAFSGITANPLVGKLSDMLVSQGGTAILTEVPEMFGAETILMNRARTRDIFLDIVKLINDFKSYYKENGQPIFENPSPGNKEGGITTLEEKSLGCVTKGGDSIVEGVLGYTDHVCNRGLNLLSAPGNDLVASTALAAAGCQIVLFTTGRGTPLGTCVPTVKIATNSNIYERKNNWFDFNAGSLLQGNSVELMVEELKNCILSIASGKLTKAEEFGFREIAIFKKGVTL